jgi:transcriptional regulator with XRE-family HTH domain
LFYVLDKIVEIIVCTIILFEKLDFYLIMSYCIITRNQHMLTSSPATRKRKPSHKGSTILSAKPSTNVDVGGRIRTIRLVRQFSLRALAETSGLNVNTLSMIENNKTSPSVSTLQALAGALNVPLTALFETDEPKSRVAFHKADERAKISFTRGQMEDLGAGMTRRGAEPFVVNLEPGAESGPTPIVHTGREFVFCLEGKIIYTIEEETYILEAGDSLLFEAHLPHRWKNIGKTPSRSILVLCPTDANDHPTERHFG